MAIDIASVINFRDLGYSRSPEATGTEKPEESHQGVSAIAVLKALAESESIPA